MRGQIFSIAGLVCVLASQGCSCGDAKKEPPKPAAAPSAAPPPPPSEPATPSSVVTFESTDKVPLSGQFFLAKDPTAPVVVFVHRFRGDRTEWDPVIERLAKSEKRYTILNFDLRGHGASKSAGSTTATAPASTTKKRESVLDWAAMSDKDMPALVRDVRGAIQFAFEQTENKARGAVVVGTSLGAALAAKAAGEDARVMAVGVVSPGAAINGFDVYRPFAAVRQLPSFVASAKGDNVSKEPAPALAKMAGASGTVHLYEGGGHSTVGLVRENAPLVDDLEAWLLSVFDRTPVEREVTPEAEPEPAKKKKVGR